MTFFIILLNLIIIFTLSAIFTSIAFLTYFLLVKTDPYNIHDELHQWLRHRISKIKAIFMTPQVNREQLKKFCESSIIALSKEIHLLKLSKEKYPIHISTYKVMRHQQYYLQPIPVAITFPAILTDVIIPISLKPQITIETKAFQISEIIEKLTYTEFLEEFVLKEFLEEENKIFQFRETKSEYFSIKRITSSTPYSIGRLKLRRRLYERESKREDFYKSAFKQLSNKIILPTQGGLCQTF